MLETASLRSKHPANSSLKTYGSRNRRHGNPSSSRNPSGDQRPVRKFDWDRIDRERKARIEEACAKATRMQEIRPTALPDSYFADADVEAQLYSDPGHDYGVQVDVERQRSSNGTHEMTETVLSTQGSDSESTQDKSVPVDPPRIFPGSSAGAGAYRRQAMTVPSTQSSDSENEHSRTPLKRHTSSNSITRAFSRPGPQDLIASPRRKSTDRVSTLYRSSPSKKFTAIPQEKAFSEINEDDDMEDDSGSAPDDEVLFRTPSFDILQRLKQLPRPQFPAPQANLFALEQVPTVSEAPIPEKPETLPLVAKGGSNHSNINSNSNSNSNNNSVKSQDNSSKIGRDILRNPFLNDHDDPPPLLAVSRTSLLEKRRQLLEMQRHGRSIHSLGFKRSTAASLETETLPQDRQKPVSNQESEQKRTSQYIRTTTPERDEQHSDLDHDSGVEQALGKRISTIQITPKREQAKIRRTSLFTPVPHTNGSSKAGRDFQASNSTSLFLNRDIPDDTVAVLPNPQRPTIVSASMIRSFGKATNSSVPPAETHRTPPKHGPPVPVSPIMERIQKEIQRKPTTELHGPSLHRSKDYKPQNTLEHREIEKQISTSNAAEPEPKIGLIPLRHTRSLRRPPSASLGHQNPTFKPSVQELLSFCEQDFFDQFRGDTVSHKDSKGILDFDSFLPADMSCTLTKIGEASYSEVYTVDLPSTLHNANLPQFKSHRLNSYLAETAEDDLSPRGKDASSKPKLVMKVLPFVKNQPSKSTAGRQVKSRQADDSSLLALEDIYRETMVSTQMIRGWRGFIGSFGALVVRGKYPKTFLSAWDHFKKENGTESYRPDTYTEDQLYCIILLPYGGIDLEHCPINNWRQAWGVLAQVAASLESKEQAPFWFEHRDLHWGNILVKGTQQDHVSFAQRDNGSAASREDTSHDWRHIPTFGILVQMIDFTLARMQGNGGKLIYMDLEKDQDIFRGQNDYQFEIYRKMRKQVARDWAASCPRTNLFWLHYLADKLLTEKGLDKPRQSSASSKTKLDTEDKPVRTKINGTMAAEDMTEMWCYDRLQAVSQMNIDRHHGGSGKVTPSGFVLEILLRAD